MTETQAHHCFLKNVTKISQNSLNIVTKMSRESEFFISCFCDYQRKSNIVQGLFERNFLTCKNGLQKCHRMSQWQSKGHASDERTLIQSLEIKCTFFSSWLDIKYFNCGPLSGSIKCFNRKGIELKAIKIMFEGTISSFQLRI